MTKRTNPLPDSSAPSQRIAYLERELALSRQECADLREGHRMMRLHLEHRTGKHSGESGVPGCPGCLPEAQEGRADE